MDSEEKRLLSRKDKLALFISNNWLEIFIAVGVIVFHNWNYDRIYGGIADDLPKHYRVVRSILIDSLVIPYRKVGLYPPFFHIVFGYLIALVNMGRDFSVEFFHAWSHNIWFVFLGGTFIISNNIIWRLTKSRYYAIIAGLLISLNSPIIRLMRWFGIPQFLGIFFILALQLLVIKVIQGRDFSREKYLLLTLLSLCLALTHQYSIIIWALCLSCFLAILFIRLLRARFKSEFDSLLFKFLFLPSGGAAILSILVYNHQYILDTTGVSSTASEMIEFQLSGTDKRYKAVQMTVRKILEGIRKYIDIKTLPAIGFVSDLPFNKSWAPAEVFLSMFFVIPVIINMLSLTGHPMHFFSRMPYYWEPMSILLGIIFLKKLEKSISPNALRLMLGLYSFSYLIYMYYKR